VLLHLSSSSYSLSGIRPDWEGIMGMSSKRGAYMMGLYSACICVSECECLCVCADVPLNRECVTEGKVVKK